MIFYSLLAVVFLSPLPYGSNRPWSWSLCILLISLLGGCWAIHYLFSKKNVAIFHATKAIIDIIIAFFCVIFWGFIQQSNNLLPSFNHPLWKIKNELLNTNTGFISLAVTDTHFTLLRYISYALVFWLSLCYSQTVMNARKILQGFMLMGFIYSLYGLVMVLGHVDLILFKKIPDLHSVSSTFINHNHFATFAGLTLLCCLALLHQNIAIAASYYRGGNLGLQLFLENLIIRAWFPLLAFITISTALMLSNSRGGFFSSILGLIVLLLGLNSHKKNRNKKMFWGFMALITISSIIFYISSDSLVDRLNSQGLSDPLRKETYQLVWKAILTNPYLGFGAGSFAESFTLYKSLGIAGGINYPYFWDFAHNTYLETIFELGFPCAILLFYCFFRLAFICLKGLFIRKKDWLYAAVGLAATVLIASHALVDFSLQIPAVAYCYFLLMGCACGQSFSSIKRESKIRTA